MSKRTTCADTAHDFDKFDDASIFCRNCGEQRLVSAQAQPAYFPCARPHYPTYYPWWQYSGTVPLTQPAITYGTIAVGNTASGIYPDTTYTAENR